jgi:uncharacterized DUF497 family protein
MYKMNFEWDENKREINLDKHGLDFFDVTDVWLDPNNFDIYDENHSSSNEERWIKFGKIESGKIVCVVYTEIEKGLYRIISSFSDKKIERIYYEQND